MAATAGDEKDDVHGESAKKTNGKMKAIIHLAID